MWRKLRFYGTFMRFVFRLMPLRVLWNYLENILWNIVVFFFSIFFQICDKVNIFDFLEVIMKRGNTVIT